MARIEMEKLLSKKVIVPIIVVQLLIVSIFMLQISNVRGQGRIIKIVDSVTNSNNVTLGNETEPLPLGGIPFTVKIFLNGTTSNLLSFQVAATFVSTTVRCTNAWIPKDDPSYIFRGLQDVSAIDIRNDYVPPQAVAGATLLNPDDAVTVESGLLCMMNFTALKIGNLTISFLTGVENTFLLDKTALDIPFTTEYLSVTIVGFKSPPIASFTFSPQIPKVNQTVTFDASGSYSSTGEIASYIWDFGDNTTTPTTNKTIDHKYVKNGLYRVNLTVIDAEGLNGSRIDYVPVGYPPNAVFTYVHLPPPPPWPVPDLCTFNATESTDPDGTIVSYAWDFGDGNTTETADPIVTHEYLHRGVYNVNLTVTDNDGLLNPIIKGIMVGVPPFARFEPSPSTQKAGEPVLFDASSSAIGETAYTNVSIVSYKWDFDDGNMTTTNTSIITHVFVTSGDWNVTLTVYDTDGLHGSCFAVVSVTYTPSLQGADWSGYIVVAVIIAIIASMVIIKRRRAVEEEEALEI